MLSLLYLIAALVVAFLALIAGKRYFALVIVLVSLLTNLISVIIYYLSPALSRVSIAVAARELTVYLFFFLTFFLVRKLRWPVATMIDRVYLALLVFFAVFIVGSIPRNGFSALLMGRELIFPLTTFFIFRFINLDGRAITSVMRLIIGIAVVTATLAILEQVYVNLINPLFWNELGISGYLAQKYGSFTDPFPLSWVNYLPVFIGLDPTMRSVGLMFHPIVTGQFLACSLSIALYWINGWKKYIIIPIIILGAISTFSKAMMLIIFIIFGGQALRLKSTIVRNALILAVLVCVLATGMLLLSTGDDAFTHFGSFRAGLEALTTQPLGAGIGSTGYFNWRVSGQGEIEALDTTFSVYVYQMGWIGLVALLFLVLTPVLTLLLHLQLLRRRRLFVADDVGRLLMTTLPISASYSILAFSSAAAFTAVPVFIPMLLLGIYCTAWIRLRAEIRHPVTPLTASSHP